MATHVALLRGINVGGNNKIPMPELKAALTDCGLEDVVTYIQSGNIVFQSAKSGAAAVVEKCIADTFGLEITVLVRSPKELAAIAKSNPFLDQADDLKFLHVLFLNTVPKPDAVAGLDPDRSPDDQFAVDGQEIYLHFPNGSGRTKLTLDYFERRLKVRGTARNWKTLNKLLELAGD